MNIGEQRRNLKRVARIVGNIVARMVLSDQARNDRQMAHRALEDDKLIKHLGKHLFKWLYFPHHPARNGWIVEINSGLANIFEKLVKKQHQVGGRVHVDSTWFDADDLQDALDSITARCQTDALKSVTDAQPANVEEADDFTHFGFKVHQRKDHNGIHFFITYKGEKLADTGDV